MNTYSKEAIEWVAKRLSESVEATTLILLAHDHPKHQEAQKMLSEPMIMHPTPSVMDTTHTEKQLKKNIQEVLNLNLPNYISLIEILINEYKIERRKEEHQQIEEIKKCS